LYFVPNNPQKITDNYRLYATLRYSTLLYATPLYATLRYSTLLYAMLLYSTLLCATLRYSMLLYATLLFYTLLLIHYTLLSRVVLLVEQL
jgi:hypothetical protein